MGQRKGEKMKILWFISIIPNLTSVLLGAYVAMQGAYGPPMRLCGLAIMAFAITNIIAIVDIIKEKKHE